MVNRKAKLRNIGFKDEASDAGFMVLLCFSVLWLWGLDFIFTD